METVFFICSICLLGLMELCFLSILIGSYLAYRYAFGRNKKREATAMDLAQGEKATSLRRLMRDNISRLEAEAYEPVSIRSSDGLTLAGRYYHHADGAPVVIFFHGYRGLSVRDNSGGYWLMKELGMNVLAVDQRAHGDSEGKTISFGIREREDCLGWIDYVSARFGSETPVLLMGISMGAATVLLANGLDLPSSVKGVLADCGYSSVEGILRTVARQMGVPVAPALFLLRTGARLFGQFELADGDVTNALRQAKKPVFFVHGLADSFVPAAMTQENYEACSTEKEVLFVEGADHGLSFYFDYSAYEAGVRRFCARVLAK